MNQSTQNRNKLLQNQDNIFLKPNITLKITKHTINTVNEYIISFKMLAPMFSFGFYGKLSIQKESRENEWCALQAFFYLSFLHRENDECLAIQISMDEAYMYYNVATAFIDDRISFSVIKTDLQLEREREENNKCACFEWDFHVFLTFNYSIFNVNQLNCVFSFPTFLFTLQENQ